jgi:PPM family protein phosphatase
MRVHAAAASDPGLRRDGNEDAYLVRADLGLFVVADGMGGHAAGEVAAQLALEAIEAEIVETSSSHPSTWPAGYDPQLGPDGSRLAQALRRANQEIGEQATVIPDIRGMATTAVALLINPRPAPPPMPADDDATVITGSGGRASSEPTALAAVAAHVGDSRLYLWRDGRLDRLTRDHSWVEEQVQAGALSPQEARVHPWRNLVTRALSGGTDPGADLLPLSLEPGDRLLLCTDGLTTVVTDDQIGTLLGQSRDSHDTACTMLVDAANAAGGPDNITVIVVDVS